jgi:excisionase family DNA binding protein
MEMILITPERISHMITVAVANAINGYNPQVTETLSDRVFLDEAEQITGLSKSKLYKLTANKEIPFSRFSNKLVFSRKDLYAWMESQTVPQQSIKSGIAESLMIQAKKRANK